MNKYYEMFRKNFPYIVRDENEALKIISNPDNKIIGVNDNNNLIGVSIIHKNTILMLCVNENFRNLDIEVTKKGLDLRDKALDIPSKIGVCLNLTDNEAETLYKLSYKILNNIERNEIK